MPSHEKSRMPLSKQKQKLANPDLSPSKVIQQAAFKTNALSSPPRTPPQGPSRSRHGRQNSSIRAVPPETFLDDIPTTYSRSYETFDLQEDPHDLSLSPRHITRASIVDNMLLSLDQFDHSSFGWEADPALVTEHRNTITSSGSQDYTIPRLARNRGHTYSSSHSSEPDIHTGEQNVRPSAHLLHGRRRTSSTSEFQSNLARIPSVADEKEHSHRSRVYQAQRAAPRTERVKAHTRGGKKGSKSSVASSVDLGDMIAGTRINTRKRRSASFDLGQTFQRYVATSTLESPDTAWASQRVRDVASSTPEYSIAAEPRRQDLPTNPLSPVGHYVRPTMAPKEIAKTSKMPSNRKVRTETLGTATIRSQEDELQKIRESLRQIPPVSTLGSQVPPGPLSGRKPSLATTSSAEQVPAAKERQGFFRRVFGSAKPSGPATSASISVDYQAPRQENVQRPQDLSSSRRQTEPPTFSDEDRPQRPRDPQEEHSTVYTQSAPPTRDGHVITKKSSFFRRRKKSLSSDDVVPPVPSLRPTANDTILPPQHSPVSSLREVMGPYLASPPSPSFNRGGHFGVEEPPPALKSPKHGHFEISQAADDRIVMPSSAKLEVPSPRMSRKAKGPSDDVRDNSFLADSSGNEDTSPSSSPAPKPRTDGRPSPVSSTSRTSQTRPGGFSEGNKTDEDEFPQSTAHSKQDGGKGLGLQSPASPRAQPDLHPISTKNSQGWLSNSSSEENLDRLSGSRVPDQVKQSPHESASDASIYQSADSTPQLRHKSPVIGKLPRSPRVQLSSLSPQNAEDEKLEQIKAKALEIFENRDTGHEQVGAWLGEVGNERELIRIAFMRLFDWSGQNILSALRGLCARIALKGESQQVDRLLDDFSQRWCECNPNHGFKSNDVVHTICYSLLLLNTDLHLANIDQKMTRHQFIRNTLQTVRQVALESSATGSETIRAKNSVSGSDGQPPLSPSFTPEALGSKSSLDLPAAKQSGARPTDRLSREDSGEADAIGGPLVSSIFKGSSRAWEGQIDTVLKGFYQSIARERLPLFGAPTEAQEMPNTSNSLLAAGSNVIRRTPSVLSRAQSEFTRGRVVDSRSTAGRWSSKNRSRPRLYPMNNMGSTRTSFDDQSSVWTPSVNSTWSKTSIGKTLTSLSVESFGSAFPGVDYQKSIGFANALSQAIVREDALKAVEDEGIKEAPLLEDESLGLAGAPWAKEGLVKHKHHLDGIDKRAKDRNWNECFAVIEKGWMRLFSFQVSAKTIRQRAKDRHNPSVPVGGGNWMDNAEEIWKFLLRQTIASALPPPGYSKARPHVWALSLPTGAVHLFEAGTPEIVKEFVSTANYWSARMSKEPLVGAISSMEYGWSDNAINRALTSESTVSVNQPATSASPTPGAPRPSIQSSIRSSLDHPSIPTNFRPAPHARLPGDRLQILDWSPPQQSLMPSALMEVDQLKALTSYVKNIEDELQKHNELRAAMLLAYTPRHPNAIKAMHNWERKSSYLLREIVKFRTYIDALKAADGRREDVYRERRVLLGDESNDDTNLQNHNDDPATLEMAPSPIAVKVSSPPASATSFT